MANRARSPMHPRQQALGEELEAVWLEATKDADIDPSKALLFAIEGRESASGLSGWSAPRSFGLNPDPDLPELRPLLDQLNAEAQIDSARILVWTGRSTEGLAAIVRHELEHTRQFDTHGADLLRLMTISQSVLAERVDGLPGGAVFYQMLPHELDANAAAAMFVQTLFGIDRVVELLEAKDPDSALLRSRVGPGPVKTLPTRVVRFLAAIPDLCEIWAAKAGGGGISFDRWLETYRREAGDLWLRLVNSEIPPPIDQDLTVAW